MNMIKTKTTPKQPTQFHPWKLDQKKSFWNLWRDGVTSGFLNSFVEDLESCRHTFCEGYQGGIKLAYEYGSCNHWILEKAYADGLLWPRMPLSLEESQRYVDMKVKEYDLIWKKRHPYIDDRAARIIEQVYGFAEAVMPHYFIRWAGDFTGDYGEWGNNTAAPREWLTLEEVFRFDYVYPDGKRCPIRGRRDGTFLDKNAKVWVFDTKCRSIIIDEEAQETLPFDIQQNLYLWVTHLEMKARKLVNTWPAGTVMNIIKRPSLKQGSTETLSAFFLRCKADIAGKFSKLRGKPVEREPLYSEYFIRNEMALTAMEQLHWKQTQLDPIMTAIRMWWEGTLPHYLNPNSLISKYGPCAMYDVIVKKRGDSKAYREHVFPELEL